MENQYFTSSLSIARNPQIRPLLNANKIHLISTGAVKKALLPIIIGWGYKPSAEKSRALAQKRNLPYWALEDGFISWLHHPSQSKPHARLSYIVDKKGIYYDASKPSGLDVCIESSTSFSSARAQRLKQQLINLKVSKYNQVREVFPDWLKQLKTDKKQVILLVDQTFSDASIEYSGGGEHSFKDMLEWALNVLAKNSQAHVIIKIHPDIILGSKKGYLYELLNSFSCSEYLKRIHLLSQDVSPTDLIALSSQVATVSSQLGFEALWQHKPVICFAWPFYAGRGLTHDLAETVLPYQRPKANLLQLINAALIQYPNYLHPDTQLACEVEDIVDFLQANFLTRKIRCHTLHIHDVSLWKRSFIPEFIAESTRNIRYVFDDKADSLNSNEISKNHLFWGMKSANASYPEKLWRIEDGFIRSVGLGADLRRPTSLIVDDLGIYYNGNKTSRLEVMLNNYFMNDYETQRTHNLLSLIQKSAITKYNVESSDDEKLVCLQQDANGREIVLVTGQYQQDLSMQYGTFDIKTNIALLQKVSQQFSDAFIIYKEHPDVYSGVRPGKLSDEDVLNCAHAYVTNVNIINLFSISDRVCTICSLSGFEALLRGIKVTTYGMPFYAGWGLTDDYLPIERRNRKLNLLELIYVSLVLYPRYINWQSRSITTPESVIHQLSHERLSGVLLNSGWVSRQGRKVRYLVQALFSGKLGRG